METKRKNKKQENTGKYLLLVLVSLLLLVSFVQAYQIETLKSEVTESETVAAAQQARPIQQAYAQQPAMVGGC